MTTNIRLATLDDTKAIRDIYAPYCGNSHISFEVVPPTLDDMRGRIAAVLKSYPWIVLERDGKIVGYAYASRHNERAAYVWSVNVSVYVHESAHRSGVGRTLYHSLFALLKLQGFYNAAAGITLPNPGSLRLHESMGFEPVGVYPGIGFKLGAWHDVIWLEASLRPRLGEPNPPLDFSALQNHPGFADALGNGLSRS